MTSWEVVSTQLSPPSGAVRVRPGTRMVKSASETSLTVLSVSKLTRTLTVDELSLGMVQ